ncbi:TonB-dependent receptor [Brumimicrobium oceani]|nr:TonB-dependent receptor plug domain-containing protein [Brumimicrobium oceani]
MPYFLFGQKDTTVFNEVIIRGNHLKIEEHTSLNQKQIEQLAPNDLGSLLQYINGITIKSYGGIGGMKTLSHRGLGGEHSQLMIDGLPMSDPQNGQTNLANIQLNNVEEVALNQQNSGQLVPISGLVKGSAVQIKTFDQQFSPHKLSIRSSLTLGSFGQKEGFLGLKKGGKRNFVSLAGGYRSYDGDYPYELKFGNETKKVHRRNNALDEYNISLGAGVKWRKRKTSHQLKFSGKRIAIDQELPGAVILYNNMAQETLKTENTNLGFNYSLFNQTLAVKAFAQYAHRFTHYNDPTYLNSAGYLDNQYTTNSFSGGFHLRYKWNNFTFHAGNDFTYDALKSTRNLGEPSRETNISMLKTRYQAKYFSIEASAFNQTFIDQNKIQEHRKNYNKVHPQLALYTSDELFKQLQFFIWYKPSSRAPSFNELYYSQLGNTSLTPEESSQINWGTRYVKSFKRVELSIQGNIFKNLVSNKIIALPTQNLFVWSIQNIGKVDIVGGDLHLNVNIALNKDWALQLQTGASYQQALDISDENGPTYRDQIAYTPALTGNAIARVRYKKIGLNFSSLYIGERYSLNENIPGNRLDPYLIFDLSANYSLKIRSKQQLKLQAGIKNLGNVSYNFIKYYVMPERNYFIKLSYEFN